MVHFIQFHLFPYFQSHLLSNMFEAANKIPPLLIITFAGSVNTCTQLLIEYTTSTGSVHNEGELVNYGFIGSNTKSYIMYH